MAGKGSELCGEDEAGGTATDDQDIHLVRRHLGRLPRVRGGGKHFRVSDRVPVEIELHAPILSVDPLRDRTPVEPWSHAPIALV
jgi:hypothetical protein